MANYKYIKTAFTDNVASIVVRGHNKKFTIKLNPNTHQFDPEGETYYFKYDVEKEKQGNMQKRFGSSFCSFLAHKYGGNFVEDVPGSAIVSGSSKEDYTVRLDGVFSRSYKNNPRIHSTFTLESVLRPRDDESFEYNNKHKVFASVENTMIRLREFIKLKIADAFNDPKMSPYSPYTKLDSLKSDYSKIEEDLVSIVMLDYLFLNNDRHAENIEFAIICDDKGKYHLTVSPVFDNDRTFGLDRREVDIQDSLANSSKRQIYADLSNDMKYVIREKDCDNEFARTMNFASNYHSDVIAEYIRRQCLNSTGQLDMAKLKKNNLFKLYEGYKDINIKQDFYNFLCEVADMPSIDVSNFSRETEQEFLQHFNRLTGSSISLNHVGEITENFNIRRACLNTSMQHMTHSASSVSII